MAGGQQPGEQARHQRAARNPSARTAGPAAAGRPARRARPPRPPAQQPVLDQAAQHDARTQIVGPGNRGIPAPGRRRRSSSTRNSGRAKDRSLDLGVPAAVRQLVAAARGPGRPARRAGAGISLVEAAAAACSRGSSPDTTIRPVPRRHRTGRRAQARPGPVRRRQPPPDRRQIRGQGSRGPGIRVQPAAAGGRCSRSAAGGRQPARSPRRPTGTGPRPTADSATAPGSQATRSRASRQVVVVVAAPEHRHGRPAGRRRNRARATAVGDLVEGVAAGRPGIPAAAR